MPHPFLSQIMNLDDANERFELEAEVLLDLAISANAKADELSTDAAKAALKKSIGSMSQQVFTAQSNSLANSARDATGAKNNQLSFGANLYDRITKGDPRNFTNDQRPVGWEDKFKKVYSRFEKNALELERAQHRLIKVKNDINAVKFNRGIVPAQRAALLVKVTLNNRLAANVLAERIAVGHANGVGGAVQDQLLYLYKRFHIPPLLEGEMFDSLNPTLDREVGRSVIEVIKSMLKTEDCVLPLLKEHFKRQTEPIRTLVTNVLAIMGPNLLVLLTALDVQRIDALDESIYVEKRARAYRFIAQIATSETCAFCPRCCNIRHLLFFSS